MNKRNFLAFFGFVYVRLTENGEFFSIGYFFCCLTITVTET